MGILGSEVVGRAVAAVTEKWSKLTTAAVAELDDPRECAECGVEFVRDHPGQMHCPGCRLPMRLLHGDLRHPFLVEPRR